MNVHIVIRESYSGVLRRLADALASETGWSLGEQPSDRADLNYWLLYLDYAERHLGYAATPAAAWFSHRENGARHKVAMWDQAAESLDLRLVTARRYLPDLEQHGPTALVDKPPVDEQFCLGAHAVGTAPLVVGVSGYVAPTSGRKGEALVKRLARQGDIKLKASGRGWPVETKQYAWRELPAFYRSLDVLLCPSLIEGIPMPPLEALACGVPVVIPRDVGMLDDLPDIPGISRYKAGDFNSLLHALYLIRGKWGGPDVVHMTAAVAEYTAANWARGHREAFERMLYDVPQGDTVSDQRGVIYVAYGGPARTCAKVAMSTFRQHMPDIPIALVSDTPLGLEDVFVEHPDIDIGARGVKTQVYDLAPADWGRVLYLDADTEIIAPVRFLWDVLDDGWDMVICKNPGRFHLTTQMLRPDNRPECEATFSLIGTDQLLQLNGGVFGFRRNERMASMMRAWHVEWQRWGKRDQAALLRALWSHPVRMYVLGVEWNTITRYDPRDRSAGVLHHPMTARRWTGIVRGRSDSSEAWRAVKRWKEGKR